MAGITTIIAIIAFFIAIAALWMSTEALKKVEARVQKTIDSRLKAFSASMNELGDAVKSLRNNQEIVVNRVKDVTRNRESADVEMQTLRQEMDELTRALNSVQSRHSGNQSRMG